MSSRPPRQPASGCVERESCERCPAAARRSDPRLTPPATHRGSCSRAAKCASRRCTGCPSSTRPGLVTPCGSAPGSVRSTVPTAPKSLGCSAAHTGATCGRRDGSGGRGVPVPAPRSVVPSVSVVLWSARRRRTRHDEHTATRTKTPGLVPRIATRSTVGSDRGPSRLSDRAAGRHGELLRRRGGRVQQRPSLDSAEAIACARQSCGDPYDEDSEGLEAGEDVFPSASTCADAARRRSSRGHWTRGLRPIACESDPRRRVITTRPTWRPTPRGSELR